MQETSDALADLVERSAPRLRAIAEGNAAERPEGDYWSPKERLGHLIDAAANHHQHLVRAMLDELLSFPAYDHGAWVEVQKFQDAPWVELVEWWLLLNRHLIRIMRTVPEEKMGLPCLIGRSKPVTFEKLNADYFKLVRRHISQLVPDEQA